jgi:MoaA/NifB/PqqE/SkfB family radical SAM enzyme
MGFKDIELVNTPLTTGQLEALEIGLTSKCNFNCDYCGAYNRENKESLSAEVVIELIKELPDLKRIRLSGGEVTLLFDDCLRIVEFCTSKGIESQINTNGSALDAHKIDLLDKAGLNYMHYSFNHASARSHHNYYKRGEQTFQRIVENLKHTAVNSSIDAIIETIIFEETVDRFPELYDLSYGLGVRKWQIQTPVRQDRWNTKVSKEKIMDIIESILKMKKPDSEYYFTCLEIDRSGCFYKKIEKLLNQDGIYFPNCVEGKSQLHLHGNGEILICDIGNPVVVGNIKKGDSLKTILSHKSAELAALTKQCACTTYV